MVALPHQLDFASGLALVMPLGVPIAAETGLWFRAPRAGSEDSGQVGGEGLQAFLQVARHTVAGRTQLEGTTRRVAR